MKVKGFFNGNKHKKCYICLTKTNTRIMLSADTAYRILLYCCNQYQGGEPTPEEYKLIMQFAQAGYQSFLLGNFEQYQYGRPISRVSLGQNQHVYESLSPFIKDTTLTIAGSTAALPDDWVATVNVGANTGFQDYRFVPRDSWNNWATSVIDPVADNPIFTINMDGYKFLPATLQAAVLTYVQTPPDTIWAYTEDEDGLPVYDAANSVGLKWSMKDATEVIARALKLVGVNLQAGAVMQLSNDLIKAGQ
jgi:hypothetical protein